jgi:hypothetical protein
MKLEIKNDNDNYAARFVQITDLVPIPNANNIQHAIINANSVIVSKDTKIGDVGVFFPVESQISKSFLSKNNLFSDKMLNADQTQSSYFSEKARVRCVKFLKAPSEGYFVSLSYFKTWKNIDISEWNKISFNTPFDTIDGEELCKKYYIRQPQTQCLGGGIRKQKKQPSILIPGQYNLHYSTSKLADNIHLIDPEDVICISDKWHGTSQNCGRVLVNRRLSFWEKIKKFIHFPVQLTEYKNIYGSRTVLKSLIAESNHYYKEDIWKTAFEEMQHALTDGISIYSEIVGYTPSGSAIQGKWNYGCKQGEHKTVVYRVTHTDPTGKVTEYSMKEVEAFCKDNKLEMVPVFYYGKAKDLFSELDVSEHWHTEFLKKLRNSFNMEQKCKVCNNGVFAEGICVRNETKGLHALKLKSFAFLKEETTLLDAGVVDMETSEGSEES